MQDGDGHACPMAVLVLFMGGIPSTRHIGVIADLRLMH